MSDLIRRHDWAATPIGALDAWPASLRTVVDLLVRSPLATSLLWGTGLHQVYNDAHAVILGTRHPRALGESNHATWPEVQEFLGPVYERVFAGESFRFPAQRVVIERSAGPEEAWFDLTYVPVHLDGKVAGILATVIEVSAQVRATLALERNEERFQTFSAAGVAFRMSADWREMRQLDGHGFLASLASPSTDWMRTYIPESSWPAFDEAVARARATGAGFELEHQVLRADGSTGWMLTRAVPLLDASGEVHEWFGSASDVSERRHTLEELRRANQRIALALDAGAVAGTWFWDIVQDRFTADIRFARYFALDPSTLAEGVPLAEVVQSIHPDDEPMVGALIAQAMARGGPYRAEYRVRQENGGYRWVEANGQVTLDTQGRPLTFPGVIVDIETRKQRDLRQAALLRLGDGLRLAGSAAAASVLAGDILGPALGATRAGYGRIDAIAASVEILPDWRARPDIRSVSGVHHFRDYGSFLDDLLRGEVVAIADVDTDPRTASMRAAFAAIGLRALLNVPVRDARGLVGVVLAHQDCPRVWSADDIAFAQGVADRTWAEMARADTAAALGDLNHNLEGQVAAATTDRNRLWQLSQDVMLVAGFEGRILAVNPAWHAMLGWNERDLVGANLFDLLHPDDLAPTLDAARSLDVTGRLSPGYTNRYRHRDGGHRWISWNANKSEQVIVAVGRDITADRERAAALSATEEKLRQSLKMEAVGQLTGGLAHDFNNLLASIGGSLELLLLRARGGDVRDLERLAGIAQGAVKRAAALTHRLLAFSRRQTLDPHPTDIGQLVAGMADLIGRSIGPGIVFETACAPDAWPVLVDPPQLENALLNLCINARDAMPDGGLLRVELRNTVLGAADSARDDLAPGDYVVLSVSDTGTGMSPQVAAKAFDPFFTTKPIGQGTGLGLSMIYGFVRQSGGHARIESRPGQGTVMFLYLPRHAGKGLVDVPAAAPAPLPATGQRILLVDDEAPLRALMAEALQRHGHQLIEAADAAAALRVIDSGAAIDLLVTDIGLAGGMNGRQLAEAARRIRHGLRVLFITGYAEARLVEDGSLDEATGLLVKPFEFDMLERRIAEIAAARAPNTVARGAGQAG